MSKETNTPIEKLFGSKTRAKLLKLFFGSPEKSFYVREMTRVIDEQINSVRRELLNLENIGIIKSETFDNKIYYSEFGSLNNVGYAGSSWSPDTSGLTSRLYGTSINGYVYFDRGANRSEGLAVRCLSR